MKTSIYFFTTLLALFISVSVFAQADLKEDMDYIQREWGSTKQEVVRSYMKLAEPKATEFWKMYEAYEVDRKALGAVRLKLLDNYAKHIESLTADKADEIAKATLKNNTAYQKLYSTYYKKAKKILGPIDAAKFIQAEIALQTAINHETQLAIPFIGQLEKEKKN
jgi:uncharacterized membrane-anchored protein YhcB (DUF1043 family)